jgi:hypothetical protein
MESSKETKHMHSYQKEISKSIYTCEYQRMMSFVVRSLTLLIVILLVTSCNDLFKWTLDNPVDPDSDSYIGTPSTDIDGDGIGSYEDVDDIILESPISGSVISENGVSLVVNKFNPDHVNRYWIQIATDESDFENTLVLDKDDWDNHEYPITFGYNILNNTNYYWRAKAYDGIKWSDHWSPILSYSFENIIFLTISNDGNGITDPAGEAFIFENDSIEIHAEPSAGYNFDYWSIELGTGVLIVDIFSASTKVAISSGAAKIKANFTNWTERAKNTSESSHGNMLGENIALSGGFLIAGTQYDSSITTYAGSAYIFEKSNGGEENWGEIKKLIANDPVAQANFGISVDISGEYAVVGSTSRNSAETDKGSAYVFYRNQGGLDNWGLVKKLMASDSGFGDHFGWDVAIDSEYIVVGAFADDIGTINSGSAYIYYRNEGGTDNWGEVKKITAGDSDLGDQFGRAVAISGIDIIIGAWNDDEAGSNSGASYIFNKDYGGVGTWGNVVKLTASDAVGAEYFGWDVSIDGNYAVVSAPGDSDQGSYTGSAYVFYRNKNGNDAWGEVAKLTAFDAKEGDNFGCSISISEENIVIGASNTDFLIADSGCAYYFRQDEGGPDVWGFTGKVFGDHLKNYFGSSVSLSGGTSAVGAPRELSGYFYIFSSQ